MSWTPLLFTCTRCPQSFPFMADLRAHLRGHLRPPARKQLIEDVSIPCPHCYAAAGERCAGYCPARGGI